MKYLGDFLPGANVDFKFNTHSAAGAPSTLAGSPSLAAYKDNGTTEDTDGITLTVDFDSKTGLHHVRVTTATDLTFYSVGGQFQIWIVAGTVDGNSVVGTVLAQFSIARSLEIIGFTGLGFLSGTHSTITADLGTNAPTRSMVGKWLRIPTRDVSSYISAHNTGTGVVTFNPATAQTLADGDLWFIIDVPYLPTDVALMPGVNVEAWKATAVATPTVGGVPEVDVTHAAGLAQPSVATQESVNAIDDLIDTEIAALTTAVADIPTNAELATALGTADDAVLSAIAALNNLSNAQLTAAIAAGDDATLAAIAALNNLSSAQVATLLASADDATLAAIAALNNISVADILAATIEGSTTLLQSLRLHNAVLAGKASGLATTTAVYRDLADTKNRVSATVDAFGNRTAVTRDVS